VVVFILVATRIATTTTHLIFIVVGTIIMTFTGTIIMTFTSVLQMKFLPDWLHFQTKKSHPPKISPRIEN